MNKGSLTISYYDVKALIYSARGPERNMNEFAKELGMSPAKLYRIAEGNIKKPISDEDIQKIVDHACEGSEISFDSLKAAIISSIELPDTEQINSVETPLVREIDPVKVAASRKAVMECLFDKGIKNQSISFEYSCDFAFEAEIDGTTERLLFCLNRSTSGNLSFYETIGRLVCNKSFDTESRYYIVFYDSYEAGTKYKSEQKARLFLYQQAIERQKIENAARSIATPLKISVLIIYEENPGYLVKEICLGPQEPVLFIDTLQTPLDFTLDMTKTSSA